MYSFSGYRSFFLFFVFFCLLFSPFALAQQQGGYDAYELYFNTDTPSSGEMVDVSIRSGKVLTSNIRSVRWFVNGQERTEFLNKLTMSEIGSVSPKQIVARIIYFDIFGQRRRIELTRWIRTAVFDVLWEGDSVVTPRYRGYKLAGPQVPINLSAEIQHIDQSGTVYTEKDFSFRWEIENKFYGDVGPGESSVVYEEGGTLLNNFVSVKVQATLINDPGVLFEKFINIPIAEPRIFLYPHTLLYGLFTDRVTPKDAVLTEQPVTVSVYPFYFGKSDFEKNAIQYKWFVNNGTNHQKEGRKIDISIDGEDISIPIRVHAQNINNKQQNLEGFFTFGL